MEPAAVWTLFQCRHPSSLYLKRTLTIAAPAAAYGGRAATFAIAAQGPEGGLYQSRILEEPLLQGREAIQDSGQEGMSPPQGVHSNIPGNRRLPPLQGRFLAHESSLYLNCDRLPGFVGQSIHEEPQAGKLIFSRGRDESDNFPPCFADRQGQEDNR